MFNALTSKDNDRKTSTICNISSNDDMNHTTIHQSHSEQNELSQPEIVINDISGDDSDTENGEDMMSMDTTEIIEHATIPVVHTTEFNINPVTGPSSSSSNLPLYGQHSTSSIISYQAKCASATTSAQRCRQWQILGGGFGEGYEVLLPEEGQVDDESENESDEENDLENHTNSFLEQIIAAQGRKWAQNTGGDSGASSSAFKCNCLRHKCRINQYLLKNVMNNTDNINEGQLRYDNKKIVSGSRNHSLKVFTTHPASEVLSDQTGSNIGGSSAMLHTVLKNKNNLNLPPSKSQVTLTSTGTFSNCNGLSNQNLSTQHHASQIQVETSSHLVPLWQQEYQTRRGKRNARKNDDIYCYPMPDLPKQCSTELREAHSDMLLRAGSVTRVNKLYTELVLLSHCLGGWRALLETSPKDENTLLMWLCCIPLQLETGKRIRGSTWGINSPLYSQIIAVTMAMIADAYENDTKDTEDKCLLFARNSQEASALELASLTNKAIIASWLALLYPSFGRDVNETNQQGQSVLHLLARIGDEAADTLQALLKLRCPPTAKCSTANGRMFRLDIVNGGAKTPLDVAVACAEMYGSKDGVTGILYRRVISYFHEMIVEEAEEFEMRMALERQGKNDNRNNISLTQNKVAADD